MDRRNITLDKTFQVKNIPPVAIRETENEKNTEPDKFTYTCAELINLQKKKNADYGNSFDRNIDEFGLIAALIPITNKVHRLSQLIKSQDAQVKTESIEDTLRDLACYAIMTINNLKK